MKTKILLASAAFLTVGGALFAQDPVHGVGGYYNWTPAQMKADQSIITSRSTYWDADKIAKWSPRRTESVFGGQAFSYGDEYTTQYMGVNNATPNYDKGGFQWRNGIRFNSDNWATLTKDYQVIAFKFSMPLNVENKDSVLCDGEWEILWNSPYTNKIEKCYNYTGGLDGIAGNGRKDFINFYPNVKMADGRDSVFLNPQHVSADKLHGENYGVREDGLEYSIHIGTQVDKGDSIWAVIRLPQTSNEVAEFIVALNFGSMNVKDDWEGKKYSDSTQLGFGPGKLINYKDISLAGCNFWMDCWADTAIYEMDGADTLAVTPKTKDQTPCIQYKWVKTFKNFDDFMNVQLTEANYWGDGAPVDPNKAVLNKYLYEVSKVLAGFQFNDNYADLKTAYDAACAVYNNAETTSAEYIAQITTLSDAQTAFLSKVVFSGDCYNTLISKASAALELTLDGAETTKDGYTGKLLVPGSSNSAIALTFGAAGEVDGQTAYTLLTPEGSVMQLSDGSLMLVPTDQLVGKTVSKFVFSNRSTDAIPAYSMYCGGKFYYIDNNTSALATASEFVDVSAIKNATMALAKMKPYLFALTSGLANYTPTAEEASNLFEGWNFDTSAIETDTCVVAGEDEIAVDGWSKSRWRMWSKVGQITLEGGESCLTLKSTATYMSYDGSSTGNATTYPTGASLRRDMGTFTNAYDRDPAVRDSSRLIYLNSGVHRYFAIKMNSTDESVTLQTLNFNDPTCDRSLTPANMEGRKGDVYYWDLVKCGIPVGKKGFRSQFFSFDGFVDENTTLYMDWVKTFDTVEAIPEETISVPTHLFSTTSKQGHISVSGRTVNMPAAGVIYNMSGVPVAKAAAQTQIDVTPGLYIVKAGADVAKILVK